MLNKKWIDLLKTVDYAFQPIVNIYTGKTYAVEALIRNVEDAGFHSIDALFDAAFQEKVLYALDLELRNLAITKFAKIPYVNEIKLFYNIDNRITMMPDFKIGRTQEILETFGLDQSDLCFELSEKHQGNFFTGIDHLILNMYNQQGYRMAIDDFGVGVSGLQMLYNAEPDFLKIDRFFISGIENSRKRRLFVKSIVEIAQSLGIQTIAEGVETEEEFLTCKALGCNMVQGYFVAKPVKKIAKLQHVYAELGELHKKEKRASVNIPNGLLERIEQLHCLKDDTSVNAMLDVFRENKNSPIIPIVGKDLVPLGIIRDLDLKSYTYSPYGLSLLNNQTKGNLSSLVKSCGMVDLHDSLDKILKIYSHNENSEGVLVTKNGKYFGYLGAKEMLDMVNEKNLLNARDQNPLTGLPGNIVINEYITSATVAKTPHILVYFDLDNFKPFNDYYGFRNGDRVIKLFGDIVKKAAQKISPNALAGHIGGDDFFMGFEWDEGMDYAKVNTHINGIIKKFALDVESFYTKKDREVGYIVGKNREGKEKRFSLLTVSGALLVVDAREQTSISEEQIARVYAELKKSAKLEGNRAVSASLIGF